MKHEPIQKRMIMIRYMIPLLMLSTLSTTNAADTKDNTKNQFTVTYIMLDRLQKQEKENDIMNILPPDDSNTTLYVGGAKR